MMATPSRISGPDWGRSVDVLDLFSLFVCDMNVSPVFRFVCTAADTLTKRHNVDPFFLPVPKDKGTCHAVSFLYARPGKKSKTHDRASRAKSGKTSDFCLATVTGEPWTEAKIPGLAQEDARCCLSRPGPRMRYSSCKSLPGELPFALLLHTTMPISRALRQPYKGQDTWNRSKPKQNSLTP